MPHSFPACPPSTDSHQVETFWSLIYEQLPTYPGKEEAKSTPRQEKGQARAYSPEIPDTGAKAGGTSDLRAGGLAPGSWELQHSASSFYLQMLIPGHMD